MMSEEEAEWGISSIGSIRRSAMAHLGLIHISAISGLGDNFVYLTLHRQLGVSRRRPQKAISGEIVTKC